MVVSGVVVVVVAVVVAVVVVVVFAVRESGQGRQKQTAAVQDEERGK